MVIFKFIFSNQKLSVKIRQIYASIAGLLQVRKTRFALKIAARDRFIIQIQANYKLRQVLKALAVTISYATYSL